MRERAHHVNAYDVRRSAPNEGLERMMRCLSVQVRIEQFFDLHQMCKRPCLLG